jgi:hypothetical protein
MKRTRRFEGKIGESMADIIKRTQDERVASMEDTRHPIYDCKFWIYEEKRLAPYEEYMEFYRRFDDDRE